METPATTPQESFEDRALAENTPSGAPVIPPGADKGQFTFGQRSSPFFDSRKVGDILQRTAATTQDAEGLAQAPKTTPLQPTVTEQPKETKPAEQASAQTELAKEGDTLDADEKLAPMPDVDLTRLPGYKVEGTPDDVDSIKRIVEKYKGDPDKLANALLHHQRFQSTRDRELFELRSKVEALQSRITEPQEPDEYEYDDEDERPPIRQRDQRGRFQQKQEAQQEVDMKAEIKAIKDRVRSEEIDQLEAQDLIADVMQRYMDSRAQALKDELKAEQSKLEQQREYATLEQVKTHNATVYHDRAKAILADQARRQGQTALAEKYGSKEYQLDESEYNVAKGRLQQEFNHIAKNYRVPENGMIDLRFFERAARELDPQSHEQQIRLDERRKTLAMMKQGAPVGTRVDTGSGMTQYRAPVGGPQPPADAKDYTAYQSWYLSLPPEERARVRKERGLN